MSLIILLLHVGISISVCWVVLVAQSCQIFGTRWTVACQTPLSMGFSRQEHWSGFPFPSPGDLSDPGIKPRSPTLQANSFTTEPCGKHKEYLKVCVYIFFVVVQSLKSCLTLCNPMDCSTPGFPVVHHLQEFAQTHVRWVGDAIQPSHPLSSPSLPAFNLSQHQGHFQWVGSS